jgi:hypothetical protein
VTRLARRVAAWAQSRRAGAGDQGFTTAETLMWIAGAVLIVGGLLARFTGIFNGVVDQVEATLLGT